MIFIVTLHESISAIIVKLIRKSLCFNSICFLNTLLSGLLALWPLHEKLFLQIQINGEGNREENIT